MSGAKRQEPDSPVEWLEAELRDTKARLHKVEGELDQALKQVWRLDADAKKLIDALTVSGSVSASLQNFREEIRQLSDQVSRIQDRQSSLGTGLESAVRQWQSDSGRDRPDIAALSKQADGFSRNLEQMDGRIKAMEEVVRRLEEDLAGGRLAQQALERSVEDVSMRSSRSLEASLRIEQDVARIQNETAKLEQNDEQLADRLRLVAEQSRRALERMDKVEQLLEFPEEVREALKAADFEREQLMQRLNQIDRNASELAERLEEAAQRLAKLDQRSQHQAAQLINLTREVQDAAEDARAGLKRIFQILLRQGRRRMDALTQEIKELSQGELHSQD